MITLFENWDGDATSLREVEASEKGLYFLHRWQEQWSKTYNLRTQTLPSVSKFQGLHLLELSGAFCLSLPMQSWTLYPGPSETWSTNRTWQLRSCTADKFICSLCFDWRSICIHIEIRICTYKRIDLSSSNGKQIQW